jgi:hypothetical protein
MSVSIRLIRDPEIESNDDVIYLSKGKNGIHVKYTDTVSHSVQRIILSEHNLAQYVMNITTMFLNDDAPFKKIQYNFPGYPTFLATSNTLTRDTQDAIRYAAVHAAQSWEKTNQTCDTCDSECDDMPPLVPLQPPNVKKTRLESKCSKDMWDDKYECHY